MKKWLLVGAVGIVLYVIFSSKQVELGAGVYAPEEPKQELINAATPFQHKGFKVKPLAEFDITAKVIRREDYRYDQGAAISPMDLALGWGRMSEEAVLKHINFSQSGRWYRYRYQSAPIPQKEIETHSANMHMIPAESWIQDDLEGISAGQVVRIRGKLVEVSKDDGWKWRSSLRRDDTGDGACELVYVENVEIILD
ncbi:hypothetical protein GCM10009123_14060 [Kangiella japonica]|uniref:Uncharacterized protein n=1 Tax=Kangiella japonica TaxID=647384 RepID=A0ABN0SZR3_9GAMM